MRLGAPLVTVPNSTSVDIEVCHDSGLRDAMPKSRAAGDARGKPERRRQAELPNAVEGQIAEICRDLAVQVKRMRQLQEQADELRMALRQWSS